MTYSPTLLSEIVPSPLIDTFYNTGQIRFAFCIPASSLMKKASMRHAPCYAWVITRCGRVWVFQSLGQAWTMDALEQATDLLSQKLERMDWSSLIFALKNLDVPPFAQLIGPHLPLGLGMCLVDTGRLTTVFMSHWLAEHPNLALDSPRAIQEQLREHIHERLSAAVAEFRHVACESLSFSLDGVIDVDVNNCVAGTRAFERRQLLSIFPALAGKVFAHDASKFWRGIRAAIDDRKSVVKVIAQQLDVRPSAVRALNGVNRADVGEYFFGHMEELIRILNQIPAEHQPASPDMWAMFRSSYTSAKEVFGSSDSARLVIVARLRNDLKCLAKSGAVRDPGFGIDDARSIEQFRQGLIGTVLMARCSDFTVSMPSDLVKADVHYRVDQFLGTLSWRRLVALSSKWSQSLASSVETRRVELEFLQTKASFFDYLGGTFMATNGYVIDTLTSAAALKKQGDAMGICLRHASHRSGYADSCALGCKTILAVKNSDRCRVSTLELVVRLARHADGRDRVQFDVLQHNGAQNNLAPVEAVNAAYELLRALGTPELQEHALQGLRLSLSKLRGAQGIERINPSIVISGRDAFGLTFGDRALEIWERLEA